MFRFIAQRGWVFGAAALILLIAGASAWTLWPAEPSLAVALGASIMIVGLSGLGFVRLNTAARELFRMTAELKRDVADLKQLSAAQGEALRARLALAERRLAALAIKLAATEELDEPKA